MVVRKIKEKCKDAARMRREKERAEFVELSKLLPLPTSITSQLDKASVIRLTSCYLKMRAAFPRGLGLNWGAQPAQHHHQPAGHRYGACHDSAPSQVRELGSLLLQTLDGFVFALHRDGKIMYISETASVLLGLPQIDLAGSSIFDYVLPADHNDIQEALALSDLERSSQLASTSGQSRLPVTDELELPRAFCMRMKCILPKRNAGLVSGGHKAIHCNGYLKLKLRLSPADGGLMVDEDNCALVAVGHSLLPTASTELKLGATSFMFRANLDLTFYFIEASFSQLLGFEQSEMTGQSLYKFVHAADLGALEKAHKTLLDKGQVVTRYYRLMKRTGGCVWIQSNATLVNNPRNMPRPQHVVSVCHLLADEPMIDGSCVLSEPCDSSQEIPLGNPEPRNSGGTKLCNDAPATKDKQHPTERRAKRLKLEALNSNMNCGFTTGSSQPALTYMTIGATRRISDDTSSVTSSVASSTQLQPTVLLAPSDQQYYVHDPPAFQEYHLTPLDRSTSLELHPSNSLESHKSASYYTDTYTHYATPTHAIGDDETPTQFNPNWLDSVTPPTYAKQITINEPYSQLESQPCRDYCSCSSSPDWTSHTNSSAAKCNQSTINQTKHHQQLSTAFQPICYPQQVDARSSRQIEEQAHSDYTYYVNTPYLIQYHQ